MAVAGPRADQWVYYGRGRGLNGQGLPTDWNTPGKDGLPEGDGVDPSAYASLTLAGDMNGDGFPDLVGQDPQGGFHLLPGNCSRTFPSPAQAKTMSRPAGAQLHVTPVGDFNGDARSDLLGVDSSGDLYLLGGRKNGTLGPEKLIAHGWSSAIGVGDVNRDGHPDVVDRLADGSLRLYEGNGTGGWLAQDITLSLRLPPAEFPLVIGDVSTSLGPYPDLLAVDKQEELVSFDATGLAPPDLYRTTCFRVGGGWGTPTYGTSTADTARHISNATVVLGAPMPTETDSKSTHPLCTTKTF